MSRGNSLPPASVMVRCASGYMLENPCISHYLVDVRQGVYHGDNVTSAENQQERLIEFRGWVIGFVDGEGCFSIGFVRQPSRAGRSGYRTGFQVCTRLRRDAGRAVACPVSTSSVSSLESGKVVRRTGGHDNHREDMYRYVVCRRRRICSRRVIPFFRQYPLRTAKRHDFEKFASLCRARWPAVITRSTTVLRRSSRSCRR